MLQIQFIRENADLIIDKLKVRNIDAKATISSVLEVDKKLREAKTDFESQKAQANSLAKSIGDLFKQGKASEANELKEQTSNLKESTKVLQENINTFQEELNNLLYTIPNIPNSQVPAGSTDQHNEVVFEHGEIPFEDYNKIPHWEIASKFNLIDFELGNKVTGAGFPFYKGYGALYQRALINFFLTEAIKAGYTEYQAPLLVNEASGYGTGQLPDKEGQMYFANEDNLYLIPTAEVPITNIFRNEILNESDLPIKSTGYTPCFRREAGSYGKDVRGLNRLHQFDKVEIVQIAHPDQSYKILEDMLAHAKSLLEKLGLKFRVLKLCGGDLGFTSALTFDLEVYSAAQNRWLEVSSVSNFESFQANRLKLRYRDEEGKTNLCHTLNGSALALPRVLAALLENYQSEEGIHIPEVLQPFMGISIIK
jgi:seryl-tRNA synthetase